MKQEFYQAMPYEALAIAAMFIFLAVFLGVVWRVRQQPTQQIDRVASLPLADEPSSSQVSP